MSDTISIMPLVEENRRLHDEVRALRHALAQQSVRIDQMLEAPPSPLAGLVRSVEAGVLHHEILTMSRSELDRTIGLRLAEQLIDRSGEMLQRWDGAANTLSQGLRVRASFIAMGRVAE